MNAAIEACGVSYRAGGQTLLSDVSFSVSRGVCAAIIGQNGAGKSTLLKCLGGLLPLSSGKALIDGRAVGAMSERERARRVAWLHQSAGDNLPFTVRRFAMASRYPWRPILSGESDEDGEAVERALAAADVARLAERPIATLSGGERQRAMLAAALAQGTDILFLDEPTNFLDYRQQAEMAALIKKINKEGMTVLMVTHDINLALCASSRVIAIKAGRTIWQGSAEELLREGAMRDVYDADFELLSRDGSRLPYVVPAEIA